MNYCDEQRETPESSADILPKKTNFYELRKVTFPVIVSDDEGGDSGSCSVCHAGLCSVLFLHFSLSGVLD